GSGREPQVSAPGEPQEIIGDVNEALALMLQALNAVQRPTLPLGLGLLEILGEQLQVQAEGTEVVLDLVNETTGQLGQLSVLLVHRGSASTTGPVRGSGSRER